MTQSLKKSIEFRDKIIRNKINPAEKRTADLHALSGSLIERYTSEKLGIHLHLTGMEFCIVIQGGNGATHPELAVNFDRRNVGLGCAQHCEGNPTVFVDVRKVINDPQDGFLPVLPQVVWLQSIDFCNRIWGNPIQTMPSDLIFESFDSATDGEHIFFSGLTVRSKYKFPYQIIEGRPQVLEAVSGNQSESGRNRGSGLKSEGGVIRVALWLHHHFARVSLKVPLQFEANSLKVLLSPEDFLSN
jgi:hypothetical protein